TYGHCDRRQNERKSDWMYRKVAEQGEFQSLLAELGWSEPPTIKLFDNQARSDGDHDIRAALVCLLTAGFANSGSAVVVGDPMHGWFWLPPQKFWKEWAWVALGQQLGKLKGRKFPTVDMWSGPVFRSDPLAFTGEFERRLLGFG